MYWPAIAPSRPFVPALLLALLVGFGWTAAARAQGCEGLVCGNGVAGPSEECDDGNRTSGDGCSATCRLESTAALCAGVPATAGTALDAVLVASGLDQPTHIAAPPLDPHRVFVTEQPGYVRVIRTGVLLPTPFLDIHDEVACCISEGLLSIAFHPDYETNGRFFVSYTALPSGEPGCTTRGATANVLAEYRVSADPDLADEATRTVLLSLPSPFGGHNGGQLAFGPDGFLYWSLGDGDGGSGDICELAQDDAEPLGKLLRIDVDAPPANPVDAIWAKGLRNPWRFAFDRATGDLYVPDVGQDSWEEINVVAAPAPAGVNYGWDVLEGGQCWEPPTECSLPGAWPPALEYCHDATSDPGCGTHPRGCSITGGFVYRGCAMPDLRGRYFYADWCADFVRSFAGVAGGVAQDPQDHTADLAPGSGLDLRSITSFGEDARGELYVADGSGGEIFRIVPGS